MAYIVYKHTSPSGKVYIGVTSLRPEERWGGGAGYVKNKHFNRAIKKYGWENIKHEILFDNLSKEDAFKIEIELIKEYRSTPCSIIFKSLCHITIIRGVRLSLNSPCI